VSTPRRTCLYDLHLANGGRMVDFAGWEMPLRYGPGPVAEHEACRSGAALFDVSHMGIVEISGPDAARRLEAVLPAAVSALAPGTLKYSFLLDADGGVVDDVIVTGGPGPDGPVTLVVNAGNTVEDLIHLRLHLADDLTISHRDDLALVALQGPTAADVLARFDPGPSALGFMQAGGATIGGIEVDVTRSGYTGEDGFELIVAVDEAVELVEGLLATGAVTLAGLAARDSLRLEAGLCLHGHDLDRTTTPVEAGLVWAIPPGRRRDGGFLGAEAVARQLADGPPRHRVGIRPAGRKPVRDGAELRTATGEVVGTVTSGGFGPTLGAPVAMGYVTAGHHEPGTELVADVRGTDVPVAVTALPFVPHRYHRP